jgi:ABC-type transport system substrate-binding protein
VAGLYRELAKSFDRIELTSGEAIEVEPIGSDALLNNQGKRPVEVRLPGSEKEKTLERSAIASFEPYERRALKIVAAFEKSADDLPATEKLQAIETALAAVWRFHASVRDRPLQGTNLWAAVQEEVENKLRGVRRSWLHAAAGVNRSEADWAATLARATQIAGAYPGNTEVLADIARLKTRYAVFVLLEPDPKLLAAQRYAVIRRQLEWIDDNLPAPPRQDPVDTIVEWLAPSGLPFRLPSYIDAATLKHFMQAQARALEETAKKTPDSGQAARLLDDAMKIWPHLPGLREQLLKRQGKYTMLIVGVRQLPKVMSPDRATTDAECQALELLFEGLVQAQPGPEGGVEYVPQLASAVPAASDWLRRLPLRPEARWSDGTRVTAMDVQKNFELLTSSKLLGHSPEYGDQLESVSAGETSGQVAVQYKKSLLDPLAPVAFKVLPGESLRQIGDDGFAKAPVGSGPYRYDGHVKQDGRDYAVFKANPYYFERAGLPALALHEIRMFVSTNPVADFANKKAPMHLYLDVPTAKAAAIKNAGVAEVRPVENRRVWFLAVNHRIPALADAALRRALAHGIPRDLVLAECFGAPRPKMVSAAAAWAPGGAALAESVLAMPRGPRRHHALNGPFPAGSWPICTDHRVPEKLFDRARAETYLKAAKLGDKEIELKYPSDDPAIGQACGMIAAQLKAMAKKVGKQINIKLVPVTPHQLRRDVLEHRYQLAYWHHDFPNDLFSLWPLFDPREDVVANGSNYLGYRNNADLVEKLQKVASQRDFAEVKRQMQNVHADLFESMPLIPLWQLDYNVAVHPDLTVGRLDAQRVFSTILDWKLRQR